MTAPRVRTSPPRRVRRLVFASVVLVAGTGMFVAWRRHADAVRRRDVKTMVPRVSPAKGMDDMAGMSGMSGMDGMSMTSDGSVSLTPSQLRDFGVTFATAEVRPLVAEARTTGIVTVDETKIVQVTARVGGFAERLYVNFTGQPVRRGAPLVGLYSPDLLTAEQELLLAARLQHEMGGGPVPGIPAGPTDLVDAARRRLSLWDISDGQIDEILATGQARRTLTLTAPASGVVLAKGVVQGQAVAPGAMLYTIADLSDVWVEAQLRESDASSVRVGSTAELEFVGLPGRLFSGRVGYVYPSLDSTTRAVRARIVVANRDGSLKPGMYATVHVATPSRSALTVPSAAVLRTGERDIVFVDVSTWGNTSGGGHGVPTGARLKPQVVQLGRTAGDLTEIVSGLEPGQRVVTSAQFLLDSESNLGEVMQAMLGQMGG